MNLNKNEWKDHWKDMPEFDMKDLSSYKSVIVHFRNEEDFKKFEKLINQKLVKTNQKITTWFPEMEKRIRSNLRYTDES